MKKYVIAVAIASGALFGLSAQAAPVASSTYGVQSQVSGDAVKVWHCRHWSGGWGCGGHRYGWGWRHRRWHRWH
ncbi:MAG: hypothetical protein WCD20_17985 [Rhodomicrobium sp.]